MHTVHELPVPSRIEIALYFFQTLIHDSFVQPMGYVHMHQTWWNHTDSSPVANR